MKITINGTNYEIAEEPPNYIKFDMSLIRDIHKASANKQNLYQSYPNRKSRAARQTRHLESPARRPPATLGSPRRLNSPPSPSESPISCVESPDI